MPLIKTYEEEEATGELAELYKTIKQTRGSIGNNAKLFSISPELLKQQMSFIKFYIKHPTLSLPLLASIRIMVSNTQKCEFCVDYNTAMLVNIAGWSLEQVDAMKENIQNANLEDREIALLDIVIKAMKSALDVTSEDLDKLRAMEWEDKDIFDAVNHGARMLATDIMFNTFKIDSYE